MVQKNNLKILRRSGYFSHHNNTILKLLLTVVLHQHLSHVSNYSKLNENASLIFPRPSAIS